MGFRNAIGNSKSSASVQRLISELSDEDQKHLTASVGRELPEWELEPLTRRPQARTASRVGYPRQSLRREGVTEAIYYLTACTTGARELATSIRYLGPLRDEPRVVYPMGRGSRTLPVGSHGEFTADLLARVRSRPVRFRSPDGQEHQEPLLEAVSLWVAYLGIGNRISVSDRGKLGRTIRLELDGVQRDLTTIGVGASQLLPVVVALLAAEPQSVLLFEQPELHLHPAVQSRLGDFLAIARHDIRLIVETHSENLINRLRLRVVEERIEPGQICILFGEQVEGVTRFRPLELNEYGALSEWPAGFFDEGEQDAAKLVELIAKKFD